MYQCYEISNNSKYQCCYESILYYVNNVYFNPYLLRSFYSINNINNEHKQQYACLYFSRVAHLPFVVYCSIV